MAGRYDFSTVIKMNWMVSSPTKDGSVVIVKMSNGAKIHTEFHDTGESRDITSWAADLILIGLATRSNEVGWGDTQEGEKVEVATVSLLGTDEIEAVFAHPLSGVTASYNWKLASELLVEGIAQQLSTAIGENKVNIQSDPIPEIS